MALEKELGTSITHKDKAEREAGERTGNGIGFENLKVPPPSCQ